WAGGGGAKLGCPVAQKAEDEILRLQRSAIMTSEVRPKRIAGLHRPIGEQAPRVCIQRGQRLGELRVADLADVVQVQRGVEESGRNPEGASLSDQRASSQGRRFAAVRDHQRLLRRRSL